ncbi:MAG TPA: hypothetical protein VGX92_13165 [Pyrinomonadaceae bacterium]|jgi:membrane-bound metal-dependent hydrolase YbcI (DUF457 family)|nr:hypothetical protein [Pyrinomonadaceae bacterium]
MLVGHFAVGLVAKRVEPKLSLGTLVLAAMAADFLWCIFMLAGIEHIRIRPGMGAANYFDAYDIALSHSLLMDAIWAAVFAAAYFLRRRYPRGAYVVFVAVLSHWLLDFLVHRPDMPLAPGVDKYFGLGLWASTPATIVVEGGFWLLSIILYTRATRPVNRVGVFVFWAVIAFLTLAWYNNIAGPPPPDVRAAAISSFIFFSLVVAWAYWMNRLRPAQA